MGSLPQLSIVKGPQKRLSSRLLHKIFEEKVDLEFGCNTALTFEVNDLEVRETTYNALHSRTNRLARAIVARAKKWQPNTDGDFVVAVCMPPSDRLVACLLAIWKAGAAYLPLDVTFPPNRIEHIMNEARPVLVVYSDYDGVENFHGTPAVSYENLEAIAMECSNANVDGNETLGGQSNELAIVLYTSGSSGIPKGVRIPHKVILNRLEWQWDRFPYSSTEKNCVFKTALTFVDSVSEIFGPLLSGEFYDKIFLPFQVQRNVSFRFDTCCRLKGSHKRSRTPCCYLGKIQNRKISSGTNSPPLSPNVPSTSKQWKSFTRSQDMGLFW